MSAGFAPLRLLLPLLPLLLRCCGSALLPSKQHLHQQQQQHCAPYSSTLLATVETPRGALIPSGIVPLLSTPVELERAKHMYNTLLPTPYSSPLSALLFEGAPISDG